VHHIDYKRRTLFGENDLSLISLCHDCHAKVEFIGGEKISANDPKTKRSLLDAMLISARGITLKAWAGKIAKPKTSSEDQWKGWRYKPMRFRRKGQRIPMGYGSIEAQNRRSLMRWRAMPHWMRVNEMRGVAE
jgi:hypothetical protein